MNEQTRAHEYVEGASETYSESACNPLPSKREKVFIVLRMVSRNMRIPQPSY